MARPAGVKTAKPTLAAQHRDTADSICTGAPLTLKLVAPFATANDVPLGSLFVRMSKKTAIAVTATDNPAVSPIPTDVSAVAPAVAAIIDDPTTKES